MCTSCVPGCSTLTRFAANRSKLAAISRSANRKAFAVEATLGAAPRAIKSPRMWRRTSLSSADGSPVNDPPKPLGETLNHRGHGEHSPIKGVRVLEFKELDGPKH